jgi:hypothetical protein
MPRAPELSLRSRALESLLPPRTLQPSARSRTLEPWNRQCTLELSPPPFALEPSLEDPLAGVRKGLTIMVVVMCLGVVMVFVVALDASTAQPRWEFPRSFACEPDGEFPQGFGVSSRVWMDQGVSVSQSEPFPEGDLLAQWTPARRRVALRHPCRNHCQTRGRQNVSLRGQSSR